MTTKTDGGPAFPGSSFQQSLLTGWGLTNCTVDDVVDVAFDLADAFIAARERS